MKVLTILIIALILVVLVYGFACNSKSNKTTVIPEDGYWDIMLENLPNPGIFCIAEVKDSLLIRMVTNEGDEWIFAKPFKMDKREFTFNYNSKQFTVASDWTKTTSEAYELAKTIKERNEAEKKRLEEMYKPKFANKTWYGKLDVIKNDIYIVDQRPCKFELYNDKLYKLEYRKMEESITPYVAVESKIQFSMFNGDIPLVVNLLQNDQKYYEKEKGFGEKVANGSWTCQVVEKSGKPKKDKIFSGSCEIMKDKITHLSYSEYSQEFNPPHQITIFIELETQKNNPRYIIKEILATDYYYNHDNQQFDFSNNPNCSKCGKSKESLGSEYCNSCDTKMKNTCPKCGKQEADAAIYWCAKCRDLKCPRCGINVRSSKFDKYCSDCDLEVKY